MGASRVIRTGPPVAWMLAALALGASCGRAPDPPAEGNRALPPPLGELQVVGYRVLSRAGADDGGVVPRFDPDAELIVRVGLPDDPRGMRSGWLAVAHRPDDRTAPHRVLAVVAHLEQERRDGAVLVRIQLAEHPSLPQGPAELRVLRGRGEPPFPERLERQLDRNERPHERAVKSLRLHVAPDPDPDAPERVTETALLRHHDSCEFHEAAWQILLAPLPPEPAARAWIRLGKTWMVCGDLPRMREAFERAAQTASEGGLPSLAAQALRVLAGRELWAGQVDAATRALDRAREAAPPEIDPVGHVRWLNTRATVDSFRGQTTVSAQRLREGLARAVALGLDYEAAYYRFYFGELLTDLGQHRRARELSDQARRYFARAWEEHPDPGGLDGRGFASTLNGAAWAVLTGPSELRTAEAMRRAEWDLVRARSLWRALGDRLREANIASNQALAAFLAGDLPRAQERLDEALTLGEPLPGMHHTFVVDLSGRLALAAGQPERALAHFDELATLEGSAHPQEIRWRAQWGRARALAALGRREEARQALAAAIADVERLSEQTPLLGGRAQFLGSRDDLFLDGIALHLADGQPAAAAELAERSRARVLRALGTRFRAERVPNDRQSDWSALLADLHQAMAAHERPEGGSLEVARAGLNAAAGAAQAFLDEVAPRTALPPVSAADMARLLGPDDGLLFFVARPGALLSFLVRADGRVDVRQREVSLRRLTDLSEDLRNALATDALWLEDTADALAREVLAPWHGALPSGHLVLLPHGPLSTAPLHLLRSQPGGPRLVDANVVTYAPSVGALSRARGPLAAGSSVVVGDPIGDLPHAAAEARAIAEREPSARALIGSDATRARLRKALATARRVFWAGHAEVDEETIWWSHLRTADRQPLTLLDVLELPLAAELVVLSGCSTGRPVVPAAGEPLGLAEAFHAAGARAVLATLHPVRDADSRRFVLRFLDELERAPGPAAALARTQRAFSTATGAEAMPASSWAAYRLVGGIDEVGDRAGATSRGAH